MRYWAKFTLLTVAVVGLVARIVLLTLRPFHPDELMLAAETIRATWFAIPVHFFGFGWGENVTLGYLALPLIKLLPTIHPVYWLRAVVLLANLAFIAMLFLLARQLLGRRAAWLAAGMALVNPWSITMSSIGFNAFLLPLLYTTAIYLLISASRRPWLASLASGGLLGLTAYTYGAAYIYSPLLLLLTYFAFRGKLRPEQWWGVVVVAFGLALPAILYQAKAQFNLPLPDHIFFFQFPALESTRFDNVTAAMADTGWSLAWGYALNYLLRFNLLSLLYQNRTFHLASFSYAWDVVLITIGVAAAYQRRLESVGRWLLLWFLLAPTAGAFIDSKLAYSYTRDAATLPLLLLLGAYGAATLWRRAEQLSRNGTGKPLTNPQRSAIL